MTLRAETTNSIRKSGVVAVVRTREPDRVTAIAEALIEGGCTAIEITTTVPGAVDVLRTLSGALGSRAVLGAGTVLDVETARRVIDAGARFVLSPIFRPELLRLCHDNDVAVALGVHTALLDPEAIASGHYGVLTARASAFLAAIKQARGS